MGFYGERGRGARAVAGGRCALKVRTQGCDQRAQGALLGQCRGVGAEPEVDETNVTQLVQHPNHFFLVWQAIYIPV